MSLEMKLDVKCSLSGGIDSFSLDDQWVTFQIAPIHWKLTRWNYPWTGQEKHSESSLELAKIKRYFSEGICILITVHRKIIFNLALIVFDLATILFITLFDTDLNDEAEEKRTDDDENKY